MAKQLQLLRNQTVFKNKKAAITGLKNILITLAAGEPAIASYTDNDKVSILLGIALDAQNYQIFEGAKVNEGGELEIPQEVKDAIQEAVSGIIGGASDDYNTLKKIEDLITAQDEKINNLQSELDTTQTSAGLETNGSYTPVSSANYIGEASSLKDADTKLDKALKDEETNRIAKDNTLEQSINDLTDTVEKNKVTSGLGINVNTEGENTEISVKLKADNNVLKVTEEGLYVDETALEKYKGDNAIAVSEAVGGVKTISLTIDSTDKILSQSVSGLKTSLSLNYSSDNKQIQLLGNNVGGNNIISTIDASEFVKDGMLKNVELVELNQGTETNPNNLEDGTYLKFTFNTDAGDNVIYVNVTSLIDLYIAGNGINVSGKTISIKLKSDENILKVDTDGLYIDKTLLDTQISDSKYKSALPDDLTTPSKHGGLAQGTSVQVLKEKTLSQLFDDILFEEINPTVNEPSVTIAPKGSWAANGIYEVGATAPTNETNDFNISFNRGQCTVVGQPAKNRAGEETSRKVTYKDTDLQVEQKIELGAMQYKVVLEYAQGDELKTSKGNKATIDSTGKPITDNPLPAGSVQATTTIYGTYPFFCNGASASTSNQDSNLPESPTPNTKLPLIKWTDALIGAKFASEAATETRLEFLFPSAKNVTKVEFFNTVSGKWEVFGSDKYTVSPTEQQTVQGLQVDYNKLTTTGSLSGALQLRFTLSNASEASLMSLDEMTYNGEPITEEVIGMLAKNSTTIPFVSLMNGEPSLLADTGNRPSGVANFAVNFEPGGQSPLDARTLVPSVSDLTAPNTYSGKNYFKGLTVTVNDNGKGKPSIYILNNPNDITNPSSWTKQGGEASDMTLDGYVRSEGTNDELELKSTDTVITAFGKLEKAIIDNEEVSSKAFDAIKTAVGLGENLEYTAAPGSNYITSATSVQNADALLDAEIKKISDKIDAEVDKDCLIEVEAGNGISVTSKAASKQTISAKVKADDPMIELTNEGIKTKDTAVWDCGEY